MAISSQFSISNNAVYVAKISQATVRAGQAEITVSQTQTITDRQTDKHTGRQAGRETDRKTNTKTAKGIYHSRCFQAHKHVTARNMASTTS